MKRLYSNVGSTQAALQQRPEILYALHVNLSINVFLKMVHELMIVFRFQIVVTSELVSHNRRAALNEVSHGSMYGGILAISDDSRFDFPAALKCADNYSLAVSALHSDSVTESSAFALVHVSRFAADVSLINLNRPIRSAEFAASLVLQCLANPVQHEPSRLLSYSDGTGDLVGANSVAAIGDHPNHNQPFFKRDRRVLKNGSDLRRELAFCVSAL